MSLKILVTSDFHAREDLKKGAVEEANSGDYDLYINLGDYLDEEYARELFQEIDIPAIGCTGNRDMFFDEEFMDSGTPIYHFLEADVDGEYLVILIGGDFPDDIKDKVSELIEEHGDPSKVIVGSHYPPLKLGDKIHSGKRIGFEQFRELIMKEKPALWASGHVHEDFGEYSLMKTTVLNAAADDTGKAFSVTVADEGGVEEVEEVELV
ncbi:MAG: metallophosphoesterase [Candidatus Nanohaloarchaea archaeon]